MEKRLHSGKDWGHILDVKKIPFSVKFAGGGGLRSESAF